MKALSHNSKDVKLSNRLNMSSMHVNDLDTADVQYINGGSWIVACFLLARHAYNNRSEIKEAYKDGVNGDYNNN